MYFNGLDDDDADVLQGLDRRKGRKPEWLSRNIMFCAGFTHYKSAELVKERLEALEGRGLAKRGRDEPKLWTLTAAGEEAFYQWEEQFFVSHTETAIKREVSADSRIKLQVLRPG